MLERVDQAGNVAAELTRSSLEQLAIPATKRTKTMSFLSKNQGLLRSAVYYLQPSGFPMPRALSGNAWDVGDIFVETKSSTTLPRSALMAPQRLPRFSRNAVIQFLGKFHRQLLSMNRSSFLALLSVISLFGALAARAELLYDNGPPSLTDGYEINSLD